MKELNNTQLEIEIKSLAQTTRDDQSRLAKLRRELKRRKRIEKLSADEKSAHSLRQDAGLNEMLDEALHGTKNETRI